MICCPCFCMFEHLLWICCRFCFLSNKLEFYKSLGTDSQNIFLFCVTRHKCIFVLYRSNNEQVNLYLEENLQIQDIFLLNMP